MAQNKTLAEFVQGLPAKLYNKILEYTLTIDEDEVVIDENWKPPVQLQINRATRAEVAEKFYRDTEFVDRDRFGNILPLFFERLSQEHASKITKARTGVFPVFEKGTPRGDCVIKILTKQL